MAFPFKTSWNFFCPLKFLFSSQNHFHFTKWLPLKFLLSNMDLTFHCMKVFVMKRLQHPNILLYMGSWHHLNVYALWQSFSYGLFCIFLLTPLSQEHYDSSLSFYVSQSTYYLARLITVVFICMNEVMPFVSLFEFFICLLIMFVHAILPCTIKNVMHSFEI